MRCFWHSWRGFALVYVLTVVGVPVLCWRVAGSLTGWE